MLKEGLEHNSTCVVGQNNTAIALGSGNLNVFATPAMIALMENAAMNAVSEAIAEGESTVGTLINASHLRATPEGDTVVATAVLKEVDGRKLTFEVVASDSKGIIGQGTHQRFVVSIERFMSKL